MPSIVSAMHLTHTEPILSHDIVYYRYTQGNHNRVLPSCRGISPSIVSPQEERLKLVNEPRAEITTETYNHWSKVAPGPHYALSIYDHNPQVAACSLGNCESQCISAQNVTCMYVIGMNVE